MGEKTEGKRDSGLAGSERREWKRVLVDLEVDYGNEDNYLFAYIRDISATGIFVRTNSPEAPGTHLNLRFTPTGGTPLELEGEVIWVNAYRPGHTDNLHPGMGIRFIELTADQRRELATLVKTFAYLDSDDDDTPPADDDDGDRETEDRGEPAND